MRTVVVAIHIDYDGESESIVSEVEGFDTDYVVVNHIGRGMAAVVRVVHPCELDSCSCCPRTGLPFVWVPGEEKPRCFECAKPV